MVNNPLSMQTYLRLTNDLTSSRKTRIYKGIFIDCYISLTQSFIFFTGENFIEELLADVQYVALKLLD